jgi:hypothetical protein
MNNKGQAFTEAVFILPIVFIMIVAVFWFGKICLTWQQLVSAARYGTDMIANTPLNQKEIKKDIENYLTHHFIKGRLLDKKQLKEIIVEINDAPVTKFDISDFFNIFSDTGNLLKSVTNFSIKPSTVRIVYSYPLPKIFQLSGKENFDLIVEEKVLSGSGCPNKIHARKTR